MWTDTIDKILVINTSDEIGIERHSWVTLQMCLHKIYMEKYEAIINTDGAKGLSRTMYKLMEYVKVAQLSNVLVFEDDFIFILGIDEVMNKVMAQLPPDFDLLYLGCNLLVPPVRHSENLFKIKSAYSSHAILYSAKAIDLILSHWDEDKPYDNFLMTKIQPYGNCFVTNPMLCSQRKGVSSIFEYKPTMLGMERYYDFETKEIDWGKMMEERFEEFTANLKGGV